MNFLRYLLFVMLIGPLSFAAVNKQNLTVDNEFEKIAEGEADLIRKLTVGAVRAVGKSRDAHAKAHGCVGGVKVTVSKDLDPKYQVGFFKTDGKKDKVYENAIFRFSAGPPNPKVSDHLPGGRGAALKIILNEEDRKKLIPVVGEDEYYVAKENYTAAFDVVTISEVKAFFSKDVKDYDDFFAAEGIARAAAAKEKEREGSTPASIKEARSKAFAGAYITPQGKQPRLREGALLKVLGKAETKNLFLETYNSWVPSLYGKKAVKYQFTPCDLSVKPEEYKVPDGIDVSKKNENFIRDILIHELQAKDQCFYLQVQFYTEEMKKKGIFVEDGAATWPEDLSPYVTIAKVEIPRKKLKAEQKKESVLLDKNFCERASFHPGHASADHYPIGGIQRTRIGGTDLKGKKYEGVYTAIAKQRNRNRKNEQVE